MQIVAMVHENVMRKYDWNDFYYELQEYGRSFVNDERANLQAVNSLDTHLVFDRVQGQYLPAFIQRNLGWLPIQHLQIFCIIADTLGRIHMDGYDRKCALNIPIRDCGKSIMEWYDSPFTVHVHTDNRTVVRVISQETDYERWPTPGVVRTVIERPTLVNTDVWHRIDNRDNPNHRYVLSLRFKDNPTFEDVHAHLQP